MKRFLFFLLLPLLFMGCSQNEDIPFHENVNEEKATVVTKNNAEEYLKEVLFHTETIAEYYWENDSKTYAYEGNTAFVNEMFAMIQPTIKDWETGNIEDITDAPKTEFYIYNENDHISFIPQETATYIEIITKGNCYYFKTDHFFTDQLIQITNKYL